MIDLNTQITRRLEIDIEESVDRYKSILSIPKKHGSLIKDIELVLLLVKECGGVHDDQLTTSLMENFNISFNTARNIRPTLERANLLLKWNKVIKLTNMSVLYFETQNIGYLSKGFINSYFGFLELLYLVNRRHPHRLTELYSEWAKFYEGIYGERSTQTNISQLNRIYNYLEGFNLISKNGDKIIVNEKAYLNLEKVDF